MSLVTETAVFDKTNSSTLEIIKGNILNTNITLPPTVEIYRNVKKCLHFLKCCQGANIFLSLPQMAFK